MALHHEILLDIVDGLIPTIFRAADLLKRPDPEAPGRYYIGSQSYSENTIRTVPANHSVSLNGSVRGDYVGKGREPAFYRLGDGRFELIARTAHAVEVDAKHEVLHDEEGENESLVRPGPEPVGEMPKRPRFEPLALSEPLDPVEIIVQRLSARPFRIWFRRGKHWHPEHESIGWEGRLSAYFWPRVDMGWEANVVRLAAFAARFQALDLEAKGEEADRIGEALVRLFADICIWGGVKLPEDDPQILFEEVGRTLRLLDAGRVPSDSRINSAWTKLYALARPDECVIYDSRVAAALTSVLDPYLTRLANAASYAPYRALGHVNGRGGTRPRQLGGGWRSGYGRWDAQVAASLLCRAVAQRLSEQASGTGENRVWTLRDVEAVLFMEGY